MMQNADWCRRFIFYPSIPLLFIFVSSAATTNRLFITSSCSCWYPYGDTCTLFRQIIITRILQQHTTILTEQQHPLSTVTNTSNLSLPAPFTLFCWGLCEVVWRRLRNRSSTAKKALAIHVVQIELERVAIHPLLIPISLSDPTGKKPCHPRL